jgi:hypothetical protein
VSRRQVGHQVHVERRPGHAVIRTGRGTTHVVCRSETLQLADNRLRAPNRSSVKSLIDR